VALQEFQTEVKYFGAILDQLEGMYQPFSTFMENKK